MLEPSEPGLGSCKTAAVDHLAVLVQSDLIELDVFEALVERVLATSGTAELEAVLSALPSVVAITPSDRRLGQPLSIETGAGVLKLIGPWQLAAQTSIYTATGVIKVDLTAAQFDGHVIDLTLKVGTGIIDVVVPRGVSSQIVEIRTFSGIVRDTLDQSTPLPGVPRLVIRAETGSGIIRLHHPKERRRRRVSRRRRTSRRRLKR
jgi:hypothetical protein